MKQGIWIAVLIGLKSASGFSQIKPTGLSDTSFSVQSAYRNDTKYFPELTLADSSMPQSVRVFKNIIYKKLSTENLALDVYAPALKPKNPVGAVLMVHGGGWRSGHRSHNNTLARRLAAKGFVAIPVSYSLSTHALYPQAVYDLKTAVRWMRANADKFDIDTSKIAILGFSAGGQLAALIGTTSGNKILDKPDEFNGVSSHVQAVIDIDGTLAFIHPESGEGDDSKSISAATYWFGYSKKEKPELWQQASPLNYAGKNTPPFLFINSSVSRMHAGRDDMIKEMDAFNIYSEVHSFPQAPHCFMFYTPWFGPTLDYVDRFLNKVFYNKQVLK